MLNYPCITNLDLIFVTDTENFPSTRKVNEERKGKSQHRVKRFTLLEGNTAFWTDAPELIPLSIGYKNYLVGGISQAIQDDIAIECADVS